MLKPPHLSGAAWAVLGQDGRAHIDPRPRGRSDVGKTSCVHQQQGQFFSAALARCLKRLIPGNSAALVSKLARTWDFPWVSVRCSLVLRHSWCWTLWKCLSYPSGSYAGFQLCAVPLGKGDFPQQNFRTSQESRNAQKYVKYLGKEARFAEIWEGDSEAEEFGVLCL